MPPPVPGTVVGASAQVGPGGDTGSTAATPLADSTQNGLLKQVSGNATDYIGGDNASHTLGPVIVGAPAGTPAAPSAILVPRYANHPDAIWTPLSAIDDHFDAASIDPKWTIASTAAMANLVTAQAGSHLSLGGSSNNATDNAIYSVNATGNLPNSNNFTLTCKLKGTAGANWGTAGSWAWAWFRLLSTAGGSGAEVRLGSNWVGFATSPAVNTSNNLLWLYCGSGFGTLALAQTMSNWPLYWRWVWDNTAKTATFYYSNDGFSYMLLVAVAGATTGLTASPPNRVQLGLSAINVARGLVHFDWIRFTNP